MMCHGMVDRVIIAVHNEDVPTKNEWDSYLYTEEEAIKINKITGIFVYTSGEGPSSVQRKQLAALLGKYKINIPCSVVTDSVLGRGIVTAVSWFAGKHVRSFSSLEMKQAMDHLGISDYSSFLKKLDDLGRQINVQIPS